MFVDDCLLIEVDDCLLFVDFLLIEVDDCCSHAPGIEAAGHCINSLRCAHGVALDARHLSVVKQ